jgi:hypothetical protein
MALEILDTSIERVSIVDDDPSVRASYEFSVEDLRLEPVQEFGPIRDLASFVRRAMERTEAAICDHHLRVSNYAVFDGAELVAEFYRLKFPAVLCTRWEKARIHEIRRFRRRIPVLLNPEDLSPENIAKGFEFCLREFRSEFSPNRRPWRTLVRVADADLAKGFFDVVVPGWDPREVIRLRVDEIPEGFRGCISLGARLHAHVNIGAESQEELFFEGWE